MVLSILMIWFDFKYFQYFISLVGVQTRCMILHHLLEFQTFNIDFNDFDDPTDGL